AAPSLALLQPLVSAGRSKSAGSGFSGELLAAADEGPDPFGEQRHVERLTEGLVEHRAIETARIVFVTQKTDQNRLEVLGVLAGDAAILRTGDPITAQAARVKPFADCAGGYFTDLSYLSSSKDRFHGRLSRLFCLTGQRDAGPLEPRSYHVGRHSMPSGPLGEPPWSGSKRDSGFERRLLVLSPQRSVAIRWRGSCG